jgi:hypothetical protein
MLVAVIASDLALGKNHLALFNGPGSGKIVHVNRVEVVNHLTVNIAGVAVTFYLPRVTTAGTGTSAPVRLLDLSDQAPPAQVTAKHTFTVQPAVTPNAELAGAALNTEETGAVVKAVVFEARPQFGLRPVTLREGQGVAVQQGPFAGVGKVSVFIYFEVF